MIGDGDRELTVIRTYKVIKYEGNDFCGGFRDSFETYYRYAAEGNGASLRQTADRACIKETFELRH